MQKHFTWHLDIIDNNTCSSILLTELQENMICLLISTQIAIVFLSFLVDRAFNFSPDGIVYMET